MDPNLHRRRNPFSAPNIQTRPFEDAAGVFSTTSAGSGVTARQTLPPVDQSFAWGREAPAQPVPPWDASVLSPGRAMDASQSTMATIAPTGPWINPATGSPVYGRAPAGLPARTPHAKGEHERKRSKLGNDASPFDSVEYWMRFDNDDGHLRHAPVKADHGMTGAPLEVQSPTTVSHFSPAPGTAPAAEGGIKREQDFEDSAVECALSDTDDEPPSATSPPQHRLPATGQEPLSSPFGPAARAKDRAAYNNIERKYRSNLREKIAELREAVPSLRALPVSGSAAYVEREGGRARIVKASKGTILTKATEYIRYLEHTNSAMMREHQELARQLAAYERRWAYAAPPGTVLRDYQHPPSGDGRGF